MAENVNVATGAVTPIGGTAQVLDQVPGQATTVSAAADATGGIGPGGFIQNDVDGQLFYFNQDDTPLVQMMLFAKRVNVNSPIVDHYMIDEPRAVLFTNNDLAASTGQTSVLPLSGDDQRIPQDYATLLVRGVNGYDEAGVETEGKDLMLFVVGSDATSGNPIVRAVNGPKTNASDQYCKVPAIPANSKIVILSNALYETQKEVAPDMIVPQPKSIYLQKRGMNQIVSDYFDAQKKRIPFSQAVIAEQAIANFKMKSNRTLWASRASCIKVNTKIGVQSIYTTEGVRWQFKKEMQHTGKWTVEKLIALAKMFFTGEDVPKTAIALCGKDFLEGIQCIDYSKHPEINITSKVNPIGWAVTNIHTVFGDIELKREPTLDKLGWSNSAGIIGENRLVHYVYRSEKSFNEDVDGEEAKRNGLIVWDGLALKGSCHIWVDGEGCTPNPESTVFLYWSGTDAPDVEVGKSSPVYYLENAVTDIDATDAVAGTFWYYDGPTNAWVQYEGEASNL